MVWHYTCADTRQPPRQAAPATPPPQEGNGLALYLCRHEATTPSGCACHPSIGGEWSGTILVQIRGNHPVRLRLPPLHRRGIAAPQEGNWLVQNPHDHPVKLRSPPLQRRGMILPVWGMGCLYCRGPSKNTLTRI